MGIIEEKSEWGHFSGKNRNERQLCLLSCRRDTQPFWWYDRIPKLASIKKLTMVDWIWSTSHLLQWISLNCYTLDDNMMISPCKEYNAATKPEWLSRENVCTEINSKYIHWKDTFGLEIPITLQVQTKSQYIWISLHFRLKPERVAGLCIWMI